MLPLEDAEWTALSRYGLEPSFDIDILEPSSDIDIDRQRRVVKEVSVF